MRTVTSRIPGAAHPGCATRPRGSVVGARGRARRPAFVLVAAPAGRYLPGTWPAAVVRLGSSRIRLVHGALHSRRRASVHAWVLGRRSCGGRPDPCRRHAGRNWPPRRCAARREPPVHAPSRAGSPTRRARRVMAWDYRSHEPRTCMRQGIPSHAEHRPACGRDGPTTSSTGSDTGSLGSVATHHRPGHLCWVMPGIVGPAYGRVAAEEAAMAQRSPGPASNTGPAAAPACPVAHPGGTQSSRLDRAR